MKAWLGKLMESLPQLNAVKQELEEKNRHLTLLYDISRAFSSTLDSDDVYAEILGIVGCMLDYEELILMLHKEKSRQLHVVSTYGIADPNPLMGMAFDKGEGITGEAILKRKPIYVPNTRRDKRYLYYKGLKPGDCAFYTVPIFSPDGEQVIGVLNVSRPASEAFNNQERETLRAVSNLIGLWITNAHLFGAVKEQSVKDVLTGLYNRRDGEETIAREVRRAARFGRQFSVLIVDIDFFKKYNDRYGHPQGDIVLKEFGGLMKASLRDVDYVSRWGGEEFLVILPNTDAEGAIQAAEKISRNVRRHPFPKRTSQPGRHFAVSIGAATFPDHRREADALILAADKALYEAKGAGRDQVRLADSAQHKKQRAG